MRSKMERLVLLPFSVGCISESSVAVGIQNNGRSKPLTNSSLQRMEKEMDQEVEVEILSEENMKNSQSFSALQKPNIAIGFHRLYKGFKNFSQFFVYKEEMEEMEMEMDIGTPTDVKHVTHIGCDGSTRSDSNPLIGLETLLSAPTSSSWRQFDELSTSSNPKDLPFVYKSI